MCRLTIEYNSDREITNKLVAAIMEVIEQEQAAVSSISNTRDKSIDIPDFMKHMETKV